MTRDTGIEKRERRGRTVYCAVAYDKSTGKKISKTFENVTAARQWRSDAMSALRAGTMTSDRGPTLKDAAGQWLQDARAGHIRNRSGDPYKPSAIRSYEKNLRLRVLPALGDRRLGDIQPKDIQHLLDKLQRDGASASTIDGTLTPLRAIYRRARTRGLAAPNPTTGLDKPAIRSKPRLFASPDQADAMLAALTGPSRALWATALYAGLRRGELMALRWEDVDLATGVIHVRRGWDTMEGEITPKSKQGRRNVPIPGALRDHLDQHAIATGRDGRVFGPPRRIISWAEQAGDTWTALGLPRLTLHEARHSYASLMIAAGVNAKSLSTYMGHATIAMTLDLYGHLMPGNEAQAADLLDAYLARSTSTTTSTDPAEAVM
jgi:integrase